MQQTPGVSQAAPVLIARGSSSGGRSSSFSRSSGSFKSFSSSKSTSGSKSSSPSTQKGTSAAKPGATVKTTDGKTVKSSAATPANKKYSQSSGVVGDNGYKPTFTNGYTAPTGSVIYYPQHSLIDYLPWIYLFSNNSPRNDATTVVQPDGKQVQAKPEQGFDGLAVFNWIVLIVIAVAVIAGIVWLVNKLTGGQRV